jgi:hypothetical protein
MPGCKLDEKRLRTYSYYSCIFTDMCNVNLTDGRGSWHIFILLRNPCTEIAATLLKLQQFLK